MADPIRAALERLAKASDRVQRWDRWMPELRDAIAAARAALAEQQGEGPSDEEIISEAIRVGLVYRPHDELPDVFGSYREDHALNPHILALARAMLARWGHPAKGAWGVGWPQPPAKGEVAELVDSLISEAGCEEAHQSCATITAPELRRAAELLQQPTPPAELEGADG